MVGKRKRDWRGPVAVVKAVIVGSEWGSFSYENVTPRDLYCARKFLTENGDFAGYTQVDISRRLQAINYFRRLFVEFRWPATIIILP